jgi:hypothetical protein
MRDGTQPCLHLFIPSFLFHQTRSSKLFSHFSFCVRDFHNDFVYLWVLQTLALGSQPRQRCRPRVKLESHISCSREVESVRECERMNTHTLKWAPMLGVGVLVNSRIFREQFHGSKPLEWEVPYTIEKFLEHRCLSGLAWPIWTFKT